VRFDRVLARGILAGAATDGERTGRLRALAEVLAPDGGLVLAETLPGGSERFFAALATAAETQGALPHDLAKRLRDAETALFAEASNSDKSVAWDEERLEAWCRAAGLEVRGRQRLVSPVDVTLTPDLLARWFGMPAGPPAPPAGSAALPSGPPAPAAGKPTAPAGKPAAFAGQAPVRSRLAERLGDACKEIARGLAGLSGQKVPRTTTLAVLRLERAAPNKERHG
jgi:hypothetical protein